MKNKYLHIFNGIVFFVLLIINVFIYKNRDNGYAYKEYLSYNQLYQNKENLSIERLNFNGNDSLEVVFSKPNSNERKWQVLSPDSTKYICIKNPKIKLKEGNYNYHIKNIGSIDSLITIRLNYVSGNSYKKFGRNRNSDVELIYSSFPLENKNLYSINHWTQSSEHTTAKEILFAKKLLLDSMHIKSSDNSIIKIQKIGSYILKKLDKKRGISKDTMNVLSPLQSFEYAQQNNSKVWCGDFSNILAFFTNTEGIITRSIWIEGDANGINTPGHSFNETYIDELNKWIFVDLTSNTLSVQTIKGEYLNAIQFYNAFILGSDNLQIKSYKQDSIITNTIDYNNSFYNDYFNSSLNFVYYYSSQFNKQLYSFSGKIKRYIFKNPTFANYLNTTNTDNTKFHTKQNALLSLLMFTLYWIIISIILKRTNNNKL